MIYQLAQKSGQILPPLTTFLTTSLETSRIDKHRLDRLEARILLVLSWLVHFWGVGRIG